MSAQENGQALAGLPIQNNYASGIVSTNAENRHSVAALLRSDKLCGADDSEFAPTAEVRELQAKKVLAALREGPCRATDLHALGILSPAARVMDLRRAGYRIETKRAGLCGVYVLHSDNGEAA